AVRREIARKVGGDCDLTRTHAPSRPHTPMFSYHLRLALKSLRRNPVIGGLMIGAIALGVGLCVTTLTVFRLMSANPIAPRNDVLYAVTLDSWGGDRPRYEDRPGLPPPELTYRDAMALLESDIPTRQVAMHKSGFVLDP